MVLPMQHGLFCALLVVVAQLACAHPVHAQEQKAHAVGESVQWRVGADIEKQLTAEVAVNWSGTAVRDALQSLSRNQRIAVMLDRRIDPNRGLTLQVAGQLRSVLNDISKTLDAGYCQVGPVAYIGPPKVARQLNTILEIQRSKFATASRAVRASIAQSMPWTWDALTTPAELVEQLSKEADLPIDTAAFIRHDLWAEGDLPALTVLERLTLVAVQFDAAVESAADGHGLQLVSMPINASVERSFPLNAERQTIAQRLGEQFPNVQAEVRGSRLIVQGTVEDLEAIAAIIVPSRPAQQRATPGKQVFTLKLRMARLDQVIKKLEESGLVFKLDEAAMREADIRLDTLISVDVEDVEMDELLRAILEPVGLQFKRSEKQIQVYPVH